MSKKEKEYVPPKVWKWKQRKDDPFAGMNRPIAGATHDKDLPRGQHPFQLYSLGSPNGQKVTMMFEELLAAGHSGAEYDAWLISIMEREQFSSGFVAINPNSKIPALLDCSGDEPFRVFESGAILQHLAEKFGAFLPSGAKPRAECLSWLNWQMSTAPILGGGFGHFYAMAPEKIRYAIDRYSMETKRIFDVADQHLATSHYFAGDEFTIADIAIFGWFNYFHSGEAYRGGSKFLDIASYHSVDRWVKELKQRTGIQRGLRVNRDSEGYARDRHSAADIDAVLAMA